jgi:peroxiredoxin
LGEDLEGIRAAGGDVVAAFQYTGAQTRDFCADQGVFFDCLGDPELEGYDAVGLGKGSIKQYLGPQMLKATIAAAREGHLVGNPKGGDISLNPGTFVVGRDGAVLYAHYNDDSADNAPSHEVLEALRRTS